MKRMIDLVSPPKYSPNDFYLAAAKKKEDSAISVQAENPGEENLRIPLLELELAYLKHALTFNAINRNVQSILTTKERLIHPDKNIVDYYYKFLENVGGNGGLTWREVKELIFRYQLIYGGQFTELIEDSSGKKIIDLDSIDPKQMDYAKNGTNSITLDKYGNPVGFVQSIPYEYTGDIRNKIPPPPGVVLKGNQIYIPASRIAHFKFWTIGPGFYPIGLIEPAYQSIKTVLLLNTDYAERAHTILFPMRVATIGDIDHEPSPEKIRNITNGLKAATAATEVGLPYHVKMDILESKNPDSMKTFLEYFNQDPISSTGVPAPYANGQSKNANKATLQMLNQVYELGLKDYVTRTCRAIENYIFKPIAKKNGLSGYPRIQIGPVGVTERDEKYKRLIGYIKEGIFKADSPAIQKYISEMEDMDFV